MGSPASTLRSRERKMALFVRTHTLPCSYFGSPKGRFALSCLWFTLQILGSRFFLFIFSVQKGCLAWTTLGSLDITLKRFSVCHITVALKYIDRPPLDPKLSLTESKKIGWNFRRWMPLCTDKFSTGKIMLLSSSDPDPWLVLGCITSGLPLSCLCCKIILIKCNKCNALLFWFGTWYSVVQLWLDCRSKDLAEVKSLRYWLRCMLIFKQPSNEDQKTLSD